MKQITSLADDSGRNVVLSDPGSDPAVVNVRVDAPGERAVSITVPLEAWRGAYQAVEQHFAAPTQSQAGMPSREHPDAEGNIAPDTRGPRAGEGSW